MAITSSTIVVTMALPVIDDVEAPGVEAPGVEAATATVDVATEAGAVNKPADVIVPPPVADHVNAGWTASALPNWSIAVAVNCCLAPAVTVTMAGVTIAPVSVWATVTFTADAEKGTLDTEPAFADAAAMVAISMALENRSSMKETLSRRSRSNGTTR
jgi:hypothetical protein